MPRGPLPNPNHRHRNAPTIPTTVLPARGRKGNAPRPPAWIQLGEAGLAWWKWAWHTPQAAAWEAGSLVTIARRASLEDRLVALRKVDGLDVADVLEEPDAREAVKQLKWLVQNVASLATGEIAVAREARELEDRLGLTPKARAALRWEIAPESAAVETDEDDEITRRREERRARLAPGG